MFEKLNWLLMVLPFALWGTAMAAMAPLVKSGGPEFVATLRLLPAGIAILVVAFYLKRPLGIARIDLGCRSSQDYEPSASPRMGQQALPKRLGAGLGLT